MPGVGRTYTHTHREEKERESMDNTSPYNPYYGFGFPICNLIAFSNPSDGFGFGIRNFIAGWKCV